MKIQEKFNKRSAEWLDVAYVSVQGGNIGRPRLLLTIGEKGGGSRTLNIDLDPLEALDMAKALMTRAIARLDLEATARAKGATK